LRRLKILEHALSSLWRRRFKNLSIVAVYSFTIAVLASILLLTHSLRVEAFAILGDAPDLIVQRVAAGRHDLIPTDYIDSMREIPGVGSVHPRYWGYYYDGITGANYTLLGLGEQLSVGVDMVEGVLPSRPGECAIGVGVSEAREVGAGDELILVDSQNIGVVFDVVGTFRSESNILTYDLVVLSNQDLIEFFGLPEDKATDISVEVYNENEVSTIAAKIKRQLPDTRPITKSEIIRTYDAVFSWRSGMILTVFFSALIAFCILAWDKATGISAEERREIGILKAIGWSTSDVLELKFWEGAVISVTSFLAGLIVAFVHVFLFGASVLAPVIMGWSVLFPEFRLTPYLDLYQIFVMGFLTVVPYIASTVIPSWKASITDPEEVMRA
jgi:ABC-type antimicrobial peptide transport system permease subunit